MTEEEAKEKYGDFTRGVISYAAEEGTVAHGIAALDPDTGRPVALLAGIVLTPEIARRVAANLTWQSMKAEGQVAGDGPEGNTQADRG